MAHSAIAKVSLQNPSLVSLQISVYHGFLSRNAGIIRWVIRKIAPFVELVGYWGQIYSRVRLN